MAKRLMIPRREAMQLLLAVASTGALAACGNKAGDADGLDFKGGEFLNPKEMALLSALAQTIIPTTDTPGAAEVGVPQTLQDLISNWGDNSLRVYWRQGLKALNKHFLNVEGGGQFSNLSEPEQYSLLNAYDAAVYAGDVEDGFYKDLKHTVARAYYMSEVGASEELNYDPVPGDFLGDIPFADVGKAWAN